LLSDGHHSQTQFQGGFDAPHTRNYLAELIAEDGHQRLTLDALTAKTKA
jgi:hypothetical protein